MKIFQHITFALVFMAGVALLNGCGGGEAASNDGDVEEADTNKTEVIKVEPQNFPVNELPDSYFGKTVSSIKGSPGDSETVNNLSEIGEGYPEWLDAIVSRESIVVFASQILAQMPDEVEFVQTTQKHYQASDAWRGFKVLFTTRPSNVNIFILGAYQSEDEVYWMSLIEKEPKSFGLEFIGPKGKGIVVKGKIGNDPFEANIEKETVAVVE